MRATAAELHETLGMANSLSAEIRAKRDPLDAKARQLRSEIDELQKGAGAVARQVGQLRERLAQLKNVAAIREERIQRLKALQKDRGSHLDRLDDLWQAVFRQRVETSDMLNKHLSPKIRIKPVRAAQIANYAGVLTNALRGSGLRYNELSVTIASRVSPRELVELAEQDDAARLAELTEISLDRALKVIARIKETGAQNILIARVEDDVELELLDGSEYKPIEKLSTGQRCTVVLSIIMEHKDRVVIVDQPEDHLDNAFVADTLIKGIKDRGPAGQLLLATHNANIPVLGEAQNVIHLGSDGTHAFLEHAGPLDDPDTVMAIENIMEGGAEAFRRRAEFYAHHADQ
jgi:ATPase subunit of ABC transporter with duplicated ATPase domains